MASKLLTDMSAFTDVPGDGGDMYIAYLGEDRRLPLSVLRNFILGAAGGLADTDDLGEGSTNLYFTNARAQAAVSTEQSTQNVRIQALEDEQFADTDGLVEGAVNFYYTDQRVTDLVGADIASALADIVTLQARQDLVSNQDTVTLDGGETSITLPFTLGAVAETKILNVSVNGAAWVDGVDYTIEVDRVTLTPTFAVAEGTLLISETKAL